MVGSFSVIVDDDHVEQMAPACLHVAGSCNYLFEVVLLRFLSKVYHNSLVYAFAV